MSSQSWYKDFTRRLDAINSRSAQAPSNMSIVNEIARTQLDPSFDAYAGLAGGRNPIGVGEHLLDWGGRALDLLSRPGYAVGGVLNAALENKGAQVDLPKELWEGISGKDKRFFEPAQLIDPTQPGDSALEKGGKWAIDFLASIATDPLTWIPGSQYAKGAQVVGKLAGIDKLAAALKAGNRSVDELDAMRTAQANERPVMGEISDKPAVLPKELTDRPFIMPENRLIEAPPKVGVVDEKPLHFGTTVEPPGAPVTPKPDNFEKFLQQSVNFQGALRKPAGLSDRDHLNVLQLVRDNITKSLRNVKGTFNASEIKSPWRTTANEAPLPEPPVRPEIPEPVKPEVRAPNPMQKLQQNVIVRSIINTAAAEGPEKAMIKASKKYPGKVFYANDTDKVVKDGFAVSPYDIAKKYEGKTLPEFTAKNPKARVMLIDANNQVVQVTPRDYYAMLKGEYPLKDLEGLRIVKGSEAVPAEEYFRSRRQKWTKPQEPTPEDFTRYDEAVKARDIAMAKHEADLKAYDEALFNYSSTKSVKPSPAELSDFLRQNKIILSKEEKKRLLRSANLGEKNFISSLSKMAADERRLNVESLDELAQMVKSGRIDKSVQDSIYAKLGVTTLSQAKKKLETMDNAISRLQQKDMLRFRQEMTDEAARQIDNPPREGGFDPAVVGEIPRTIPDPKIPVQEVAQTAGTPSSVTQAEAAVDRATTPIVAAALDEETKARVWAAAKKAVDYEWSNWKKKYPHKTARGAGRTDTTPGVGNAHWYGEFNAKKQYTFFKNALDQVRQDAAKAGVGINGPAGAAIKYDKVMPMLKAHDDILKQYGIHPSLVPGGGYPLSLYDVLSTLPRKWVEQHFFNTGRQVTVDQILHIAQAAVDTRLVKVGATEWGDELTTIATNLGGFRETVVGILGNRWSEKNVGGKAEDYARAVGNKAKEAELKKTAKAHNFDINNPPANYTADAYISGKAVEARTFNSSLDPIVNEDFIRAIQEKVAYNSARANIQYGKFVKNAEQEQVNKFIEAVHAAPTNDSVFKVVDGARKSVDSQLAETATIVPTRAAADEVKDTVELASANAATEIASRMHAANSNATTALKAAKAEQEVSRNFDDIAETILTPTYDLGERAQMSLMGRLVHAVAPHIAEGDLRKIMLNNNVTAGHITAQYSRQLSQFQRRVGTEKANQLFNDVRLGHTPSVEDAADFQEMRKIIARIFDDGNPDGWSLGGNGIDPRHLNSNLKHFQVHENFRLPTGVSREESYNAWRGFEPNDPLDLLSRYHAAVQKTIAEKNMGAQISNTFGSARYQPGLARVKAVKGSRIAHLINTDLYYPKDVIQNMFALDRTLKELAAPNNTNKLLRLYDSVTHAYKAGLTIYRPGHHMRNLYGDIWLGAMDGVYSPTYYKRARSVMATRANHYTDYNFNAALSDLSGSNGTALTLHVGGKPVHLSNDDVYRLAAKHGLLPNYSTIEDLGVGTKTNEVGDTIKKFSPFGGRVHNVAADVSEYRDHWVRLAHFIKVLEDGRNIRGSFRGRNAQLNAIDELAARASNRVQKWHPNGSDNTKFERNVLRRGILFYSWIRKAIPLVVETAVLHPGRFLAFPKAMYTLAESNGIDLNGFTDPFPTDQLFPNWLGGNQGPQFGNAGEGYIGMRMGIPMMDILDQYFADPGTAFQTVLGSTNPAVKIPYELATGATTQGVPINDTSKYLLGQVPFGNFVNTMLNKPIGGVGASNEGYDPGGIRDPKALATINLLTGLGLMDMSKPSLIKSGEFDVKYGRQGG